MDGGGGEDVKDKWIFGDAILLTLKIKEELQGKECKWPLEVEKCKEIHFLLEHPEGIQACQHLDFRSSAFRNVR